MYYQKRYLQFNDLVFDGYDMISDYDEPVQYKSTSTPYNYGHGSYSVLKQNYLFVTERQVNMTITLKLKKLPCEQRVNYVRFAEQELGRPGRLWAIKNNEIIWAYAQVNNMRPVMGGHAEEVEWDIEFVIPSGVWHKANKYKTFVLPYNACAVMECKQFRPAEECDCCETCLDKKAFVAREESCMCCCTDELCPEMALCHNLDRLQEYYSCDTPFQLVYSCQRAEQYSTNKFLGKRLCVEDICDSNEIVGRFYSETDIPTENVRIVIDGKMKNPSININGNTNIIEGEYDGSLIIEPNGDVYYKEGECCDEVLLDPNLWTIPNPNEDTYGWTVYPQMNSIIVNLNECCTGATCVYIDADGLTT